MKRIVLALMIFLMAVPVMAKPIKKQLYLSQLVMQKTAETAGDELYLMVTELNSKDNDQQYSIPHYPVTWTSNSVAQIRDLLVWEGSLDNGESSEIIVELVEQDAPPFNVDDSLGSAQIKLHNQKGNITAEWGTYHHSSEMQLQSGRKADAYQYHLKGHDGKYTLYLELVDAKPTKPGETPSKK